MRRRDLDELLEPREGPCISLFLPTHRVGPETRQDPLRLKNLVATVDRRLEERGVRRPERETLLEPARELLNGQPGFWEHQSDGLALFLAPGFTRRHRVPRRLPERAFAEDRFHVRPLLPLFSGDGRFLVLAISQKGVRLLQGTRFSVGDLDLEGVPGSMKEALWMDDPEKSLQHHATGKVGPAGAPAMIHGHGAKKDVEKTNLLRWFRRVDEGLARTLQGENEPLVLACVDYYVPVFREASSYPALVDEAVKGNPDDLDARELHRRAWEIVRPRFEAAEREARARWEQSAGTGLATSELDAVVRAADEGRVDTLFVPVREETANEAARPPRKDEALLERAAVSTLEAGGVVYSVTQEEVPGGGSAAALLRY